MGQDLEAAAGDEGPLQREGQRLGGAHADAQAREEPGPDVHPDGVEVRHRDPGATTDELDGGRDRLGVMPAPRHRGGGEHAGLVGQRHSRQLGRGLDGEDDHGAAHAERTPADLVAARRRRPGEPDRHAPLVVSVALGETDGDGVGAEHGLGHVAPLHDGHGVVLDQLGDGEVDDLAQVLEAIQVRVQQRPDDGSCGRSGPGTDSGAGGHG